MNKNTLSIIEKIIINRVLSVPQLMGETSFTKRQIEYQLESINTVLADSYGVPKDRLLQASQPVSPETLDLLEKIFLNQIRHYNFDHEERQYYIFLAILCNQDYLTIFHLTDELSVSKTTIQADMKDLRKNLESYEIRIDSDRVYGYTLSGSPSSCLSFLVNGITGVHGPVMEHFFKKHSIHVTDHYIGTIRRIAGTCGISFVESRLREFVYILVILSVSRQFPSGNPFELPDFVSEKMPQLNEYKFAETLLEELGLDLEEDKIEYISAWLIGISVSDIENETPDKSYLVELLRQMLIRFQALSGLQYSDHSKALAQLYSHFRPAFYRNLYHLPVSNPLTRQILEQYAATATLVRETIKPLNYILYSPFAEDELAYLTVHFASFTTQKTYGSPYRKQGAIVCNAGTGFSALLKKQLAGLFPEFDFFPTGYDGLCRELLTQPCHAVFTTSLDFQLEGLDIPVFYVPSILNSQDKYRLSQKVYQTFESFADPLPSVHDLITIIHKHAQILSEGKLRGDLISYFSQKNDRSAPSRPLSLSDMIRPALIQTRAAARTAEEAVLLSAQPLLTCNYITQNYVDSVIDTFKSSQHHTVIMKSVALPHAAPDRGVLKPGISVTVLEHPVIFNVENYDPIRYIFCLSAVDYESHLSAMASLVEFLEDKQFYEILNTQSCSNIFNYLMVYGSRSS